VGANKNSIKIIGEETDRHVQGYFVYDSKKAGATTVSHLRTSPRPIRSAYLISKARFVACHQFEFLERVDVLEHAVEGAVFLLNAPYSADEVWERLPGDVQQQLIDKRIRFYTIDASAVARQAGMGGRINTIMQTCFFAISGVLPRADAIAQIKHAIDKTYSKRGAEVVKRNFEAVDTTLARLQEVAVPSGVTATHGRPPLVSALAPDFVALTLAFWCVRQPRLVGLASAWGLGLLVDAGNGVLLGQHALAYSALAFFAIALSRRILWFDAWGQMLHVLLMLEGAQLVALGVRVAAGAEFPGWSLFLGPLAATLLWPVVTWLLLIPQRRPLSADANRPL